MCALVSGTSRFGGERRGAPGSRAVRLQGVLEQTHGDQGVFYWWRLVQNRFNKPSCHPLWVLSYPSHHHRTLMHASHKSLLASNCMSIRDSQERKGVRRFSSSLLQTALSGLGFKHLKTSSLVYLPTHTHTLMKNDWMCVCVWEGVFVHIWGTMREW